MVDLEVVVVVVVMVVVVVVVTTTPQFGPAIDQTSGHPPPSPLLPAQYGQPLLIPSLQSHITIMEGHSWLVHILVGVIMTFSRQKGQEVLDLRELTYKRMMSMG